MIELASTMALASLAQGADQRCEASLIWVATAELNMRQQLAALFANVDLHCDPTFDILLEVYVGLRSGKLRTPGAIANTTGVPGSSITRWIKFLEQRGFLQRHKDEIDGRRIFLTLTADAHALVEQALATIASSRPPAEAAQTPTPSLFFSR
ncbi:MarR family transcriptional regulator [Novosphingobium sp. CCH12-A3]|uniref:MarR family transcriptional regulator n=1 Tax=Novosphingobium sp. CCH12-A3 TaxID=1768752 RepID=UPI000785036B|nr:MarR family transcriptional regulator [Novosphingobium sp. CCH12-A3]